MQFGAFLLQLDFHNLLSVIPGGARIGHENSLEEAKHGYGDEIADEEKGLDESEGKCREENRYENIQHAFLRVLCAYSHDLLAIGNRSSGRAFELDIGLDEFHGAISASGHGLRGC